MNRARGIRRALPMLVTALLAVGAIVAVILALPDGGRATAAAGSGTANGTSGTTGNRASAPTPGTARAAGSGVIAVPALPGSGAPPEESAGTSSYPEAGPTAPNTATTTDGTGAGALAAVNPGAANPSGTGATGPAVTAVPTPPATSPPPTSASKTTPPAAPSTPPTTTAPKTPAPAPDFGIPVSLGNATQLITVSAPSKAATVGTLRAWEKTSAGAWRVVYGPVTANLGSAGIGPASESYSRTPLGTFTLTEAFGALANPGTALPYHVTGPNDWWVSDVNAPFYNTMQTCAKASCPFNTRLAEHLQTVTPYYDYAVVMDVNRSPVVKGGGSAFFLHVTVGKPTEGCIAIDKATLVKIMRWLKPAAHPRIATGIG
ncbi:MAG: L,D-transpeptidase family protein [Actinobacteria bacterium]|nr:L,D-transpeptidase family protein [Actinomycetota bacterium]